jgi:TonB family protein
MSAPNFLEARTPLVRRAVLVTTVVTTLVVVACNDLRSGARRLTERDGGPADSLPVLALDSLPFRYPTSFYIQRVQDNVTLRLYLDEFGRPVPESTRVEEHAKNAAFDTSALAGARDLVFHPAIRTGKPIPYSVLFPIKFRMPDGPPLPSDSTPHGSGRGH